MNDPRLTAQSRHRDDVTALPCDAPLRDISTRVMAPISARSAIAGRTGRRPCCSDAARRQTLRSPWERRCSRCWCQRPRWRSAPRWSASRAPTSRSPSARPASPARWIASREDVRPCRAPAARAAETVWASRAADCGDLKAYVAYFYIVSWIPCLQALPSSGEREGVQRESSPSERGNATP